jgi:hypothetical protein
MSFSKFMKLAIIACCLFFSGLSILVWLSQVSPQENPPHKELRERFYELAGEPEHRKLDSNKPLHSQTKTFELAGRFFEIPIMYIDGFPKKGVAQQSMLFEVVLPLMNSRYELADREAYEKVRTDRRISWILIEPSDRRISLDRTMARISGNIPKIEQSGEVNGLVYEKWYRNSPDGLYHQKDIFLEYAEDGSIVSFLECHPEDRPGNRFPICSHKFINGGLLYKLSYNKKNYFKDWRVWREKAISWLHRYELKDYSGLSLSQLKEQVEKEFRGKEPSFDYIPARVRLSNETNSRIVEIAGAQYDIPIGCLDGWVRRETKQYRFRMPVVWSEERADCRIGAVNADEKTGDQTEGTIHISNWEYHYGYSGLIEPRLKRIASVEAVGSAFGLTHQKWYFPALGDRHHHIDAFIEYDADGVVLSAIQCRPESSKNNYTSTCVDTFREGDLIIELTYDRIDFLHDWRDQRKKAIRFIEQHVNHYN